MNVLVACEFSGKVRDAFKKRGHYALSVDFLPPLRPTKLVAGRFPRVHYEPPHPDRWKRRSVTYQGIADAMAKQWGSCK